MVRKNRSVTVQEYREPRAVKTPSSFDPRFANVNAIGGSGGLSSESRWSLLVTVPIRTVQLAIQSAKCDHRGEPAAAVPTDMRLVVEAVVTAGG